MAHDLWAVAAAALFMGMLRSPMPAAAVLRPWLGKMGCTECIYVDADDGSDQSGDGSARAPFASVEKMHAVGKTAAGGAPANGGVLRGTFT